MHSDASVTPVDPLFCMWTATARKTMSGRVLGRMSVSPFRRPPHAVTLGAAYSLADFTVLDRNPLDVASPDELRDIKVLGTVMGGKAFPAGAIGENE
jgi:predicted amidohydrolase YtcJ